MFDLSYVGMPKANFKRYDFIKVPAVYFIIWYITDDKIYFNAMGPPIMLQAVFILADHANKFGIKDYTNNILKELSVNIVHEHHILFACDSLLKCY